MLVTPAPASQRRAGGQGADLLGDLTPSQRRAVETANATVCVLASAGAGKTRVLTRRIAYRLLSGSAQAGHVLGITFTRKAAGELSQRLVALGVGADVTAGTFHSVAFHQLQRWWADRRAPEPAMLQRKARLLAELAADRPALSDVGMADLASQIEWAKARLVSPEEFAEAARDARRDLPADAAAIAALYARYEDEKRRRRVLDFDDLLSRYADALSTDGRFAAAQRWKWRHLFVDELQDVNPLQCRLLEALLGDNDDLFVVGDPNQAIYGWNGADPGFLADFPRRWPQAEVVRLEDNHRSSPQVVAAAAAVLGRQGTGELRSSQPDGPVPSLRSYPSEEAEAAGIAAEIRAANGRGWAWPQMAVLARTNAQLGPIGAALARAGIPFHAMAPAEELDATNAGPHGLAPAPGPAAAGTSAPPPRPLLEDHDGRVTLSSFHRAKGLQWRAVWICGLEAGTVPIGYASSPAALAEERRLLYVALTRSERELRCSWARHRRAGNGAVLRRDPSPWLPVLAARCAPADEGSGWDGAPALNSQAGPPAGPDAAIVDFFASARRRLARTKNPAGRGRRHAHGQDDFVLKSGDVEPEGRADEGDGPEETQAQAVGRAVAEGLHQWRRRLARASGVPPHVLFHDSTLGAIAARRPTSTEELLAVPGLGPVKVARYGLAILEVVRQGMAGTEGVVAPAASS